MNSEREMTAFDRACRDDVFDKMVPSDLRAIIAERDKLRYRVANMRITQIRAKSMMRRARKDIMETARVNQMRLTGVDIVTGATSCLRREIIQQGIEDSLRICDELADAINDLSD